MNAPGTTAVDPLALESQICFALSVASRSVVAAYRPVLEPLGLTHPQYLVMLALWEHRGRRGEGPDDRPLSIRDLARLLRLDPGTLSPLVKRLEAQGLLTRRRHVDDERTLAIELTGPGQALRAEAEAIPGRMMRRLGVTRDELVVLHRTMTRLIAAAEGDPLDDGGSAG
ncbi:MarR family winged helix-turn-helix transcriptional regulator [Frigoribacterium sp. CFBP 13707]|uniref:MarR family winged helix-turn-helix transcriptional regulator n=1 Tax=Frigoribacterium sp. CFBP 13707 TaxID=2775313 RepID=UPI0035302A68